MGEDLHFLAKVAYLGKIKNLDCIGYHKKLDGSSKNFKQYARIIGAPWFSANFPHIQIAIDAFSEIMSCPVYGARRGRSKVVLALSSSVGIFINLEKRSEEHTSELQSHSDLVCRLLLEKKKMNLILQAIEFDGIKRNSSSLRVDKLTILQGVVGRIVSQVISVLVIMICSIEVN